MLLQSYDFGSQLHTCVYVDHVTRLEACGRARLARQAVLQACEQGRTRQKEEFSSPNEITDRVSKARSGMPKKRTKASPQRS